MRIVNSGDYTQNYGMVIVYCISSELKPTNGIANGSICFEIDTNKAYLFDEEGSQWNEVPLPSSGGGGAPSGDGSFKVTFTWVTDDTVSADKTLEEIFQAYQDGLYVYGELEQGILNLLWIDETYCEFQQHYYYSDPSSCQYEVVSYDEGTSWIVSSEEISLGEQAFPVRVFNHGSTIDFNEVKEALMNNKIVYFRYEGKPYLVNSWGSDLITGQYINIQYSNQNNGIMLVEEYRLNSDGSTGTQAKNYSLESTT